MVFRALITKEEDCYLAQIPTLKHCFAGGDTIEEAIENLKEALEGTLESMKDRGVPIVDDSQVIEFTLSVSPDLKPSTIFETLAVA